MMPPSLAPWIAPAIAISFLLGASRISGWHGLARRFRAEGKWTGESWSWQSARFGGWFGYNNCLRIGADRQWLSIELMGLFRLPLHPALRIPWSEIEIETGKALFGLYETATLRIGSEERVRVRLRGRIVERLRRAAGDRWPLYAIEQMQGQRT